MFHDDKDDSLADDVYTVLERALDEDQAAAGAVLATLWTALHDGRTRELAEAVRPFAAQYDSPARFFLRESRI